MHSALLNLIHVSILLSKFILIPSALTLLLMFCTILLRQIPSLLHGCGDLSTCTLSYITITLNYHVSIFKNMGVAATGPHPCYDNTPSTQARNKGILGVWAPALVRKGTKLSFLQYPLFVKKGVFLRLTWCECKNFLRPSHPASVSSSIP